MDEQEILSGQMTLRPRFKVEVDMSMEQVGKSISDTLYRENAPIRGEIIPGHATFELPSGEKKMWSPRLTISYEPLEDRKGCLVRGMYSPEPGIWTLFVFLYTALGFCLFVVLIWGSSLYALDRGAGVLWFAPLIIICIMGLWAAAKTGQNLSKDQIRILHTEIEQALGQKI